MADDLVPNVHSVSWRGYTFERIGALSPARDATGEIIELMPQSRYKEAATSTLHRYGTGPFCTFKIPWSYAAPGVYVITLGDTPVYVGECRHLAQRFNMGYGSIQ